MHQFDKYVGNYFISSLCLAFFFLVGLYLLVEALGRIDDFMDTAEKYPEMGFGITLDVFRYFILTIPYTFLQTAPFVSLLAVLFTAVRLSRNNELVPMVTSGYSLFRVAVPLLAGSTLVALLMVGVREGVIPQIDEARDKLRELLYYQHKENFYDNFTLVDEKGRRIHSAEFTPARGEIEDLWIIYNEGDTKYSILAEFAHFKEGDRGWGWYLTGGSLTAMDRGESQDPKKVDFLEGFTFTPADLYIAYKGKSRPLDLSFSELNLLSLREPMKSEYITALHYFITFPLAALILPLLGLPFVLRFERRGVGEGILISLLIIISYFAVDFYMRSLGNRELLDPLVASWLPTVIFGSLGIVLFDSIKT